MTIDTVYNIGDWIVHNSYGIGQIKKIEKRPIHGEKTSTYRVKTRNGVYWIPLNLEKNPRIRRVVNKRKLNRALRMLKAKPKEMADNYKTRNKRIHQVFIDGSIYKMSRLLRDLIGLRQGKKLNNTELDAYDKLVTRLSREYQVCHEIPLDDAHQKILDVIEEQE